MALEFQRDWSRLTVADLARRAEQAEKRTLNPPDSTPPFPGADKLWDELFPPSSPQQEEAFQNIVDDALGGEILKEAALPPEAKPLGFENSVTWSFAIDELGIPGFKFSPPAGGAPRELSHALEGRPVDGVIKISLPEICFSPKRPWAPGASKPLTIPAGDYLVVGLDQAGGRLYSGEQIQPDQIIFLHIISARHLPRVAAG